jgi:hypothetical protein
MSAPAPVPAESQNAGSGDELIVSLRASKSGSLSSSAAELLPIFCFSLAL